MTDTQANANPMQQYFSDLTTRIRDLEERQRLLKDRTLLIGQNLVNEREKTFEDIQELKKIIFRLNEENLRMKEMMQRVSEQITDFARKEDLSILQRQFDIIKTFTKSQ